MGTRIETQHRENLPDGSYTRVDMLLCGLKEPLILGKGEGMGAREEHYLWYPQTCLFPFDLTNSTQSQSRSSL